MSIDSGNIKLAICDDEKQYREKICEYVKSYLKKEEIGAEILCFSDGEDLLRCKEKIDIILLDIEMKNVSGIEVKNKLTDVNTSIIFLTNYAEFMREAFGRNVVGFVEKKKYEEELLPILQQQLLFHKKDKISVSMGNVKYELSLDDIYYITSNGNYLDIYTKNNRYYTREKMKDYEEQLAKKYFIKTHRSYLINLKYISEIDRNMVKMINGINIPIARGRAEILRKAYMDYLSSEG